jgi:hypothetical protein
VRWVSGGAGGWGLDAEHVAERAQQAAGGAVAGDQGEEFRVVEE